MKWSSVPKRIMLLSLEVSGELVAQFLPNLKDTRQHSFIFPWGPELGHLYLGKPTPMEHRFCAQENNMKSILFNKSVRLKVQLK